MGETTLCRQAIEKIPKIEQSNQYVRATLLDGEEKFEAANKERNFALMILIEMQYILADCYLARGEKEKAVIQLEIARGVLSAFEDDFPTKYRPSAYDPEEIAALTGRVGKIRGEA